MPYRFGCKAELDVLLKRVSKRGGRPLLENRDPAEVLQNLINIRYPIYAEADIIVESLDVQHTQMVNAVLAGPGRTGMTSRDRSPT